MTYSRLATNLASPEATTLSGGAFLAPSVQFGASLRALWDSRVNAVSATSWGDASNTRVFTPTASPTLVVDPGNFGGNPVFRFVTASGDSFAYNGTGNAIIVTGASFYVWQIMRWTTNVDGVAGICWNTGFTENLRFFNQGTVSQASFAGNGVSSFAAPQTRGQLVELYTNGATVSMRVNGVVLGSFGAAGSVMPNDAERVNVGLGGNFPDCLIAQYGFVNRAPTSIDLSNQLAYSRAVWNTP